MTSKPNDVPPDIRKELKDHRRQGDKIAGFLPSGDFTKGPQFITRVFVPNRDGKLKPYLDAEIEKKKEKQRDITAASARTRHEQSNDEVAMLKGAISSLWNKVPDSEAWDARNILLELWDRAAVYGFAPDLPVMDKNRRPRVRYVLLVRLAINALKS